VLAMCAAAVEGAEVLEDDLEEDELEALLARCGPEDDLGALLARCGPEDDLGALLEEDSVRAAEADALFADVFGDGAESDDPSDGPSLWCDVGAARLRRRLHQRDPSLNGAALAEAWNPLIPPQATALPHGVPPGEPQPRQPAFAAEVLAGLRGQPPPPAVEVWDPRYKGKRRRLRGKQDAARAPAPRRRPQNGGALPPAGGPVAGALLPDGGDAGAVGGGALVRLPELDHGTRVHALRALGVPEELLPGPEQRTGGFSYTVHSGLAALEVLVRQEAYFLLKTWAGVVPAKPRTISWRKNGGAAGAWVWAKAALSWPTP